MVAETNSSLNTTIIIYYYNTNTRDQKGVTIPCCYNDDYRDRQHLHHEKHEKSEKEGLHHGKIGADHTTGFEPIKLKFRNMDLTKFQEISQN